MPVRAKFRCDFVKQTAYGSKEVSFSAVYSTTGENADFAKATPSGSLSMWIDQQTPASDYFTPGREYYLTISEADPATV